MPFSIPTNDPGPPPYGSVPNVIRAETLSGLVLRDRWIFATSRRCLVKCCGRVADSGAPVLIHTGDVRSSGLVTGNIWIVASGFDAVVGVAFGAITTSITLAPAHDTSAVLHTGVISPSVIYPYAVTLSGSPGRLYGLAIYEERLASSDLP